MEREAGLSAVLEVCARIVAFKGGGRGYKMINCFSGSPKARKKFHISSTAGPLDLFTLSLGVQNCFYKYLPSRPPKCPRRHCAACRFSRDSSVAPRRSAAGFFSFFLFSCPAATLRPPRRCVQLIPVSNFPLPAPRPRIFLLFFFFKLFSLLSLFICFFFSFFHSPHLFALQRPRDFFFFFQLRIIIIIIILKRLLACEIYQPNVFMYVYSFGI